MPRGTDGWRTLWATRLPDEVATPFGVRRPLLPAWPFLAVAAGSLALSAAVAAAAPELRPVLAVLAVALAAPALLAHLRPVAAVACSVVVNVSVLVVGMALEPGTTAPPWYLNVAPPQLLAAYTVGVVLPGRAAAVATGAVIVSGAAFAPATQPAAALRPYLPVLLAWAALLAVAVLLGARRRDRHERTLRLVAEGEQRRVGEERDRIARELHDVVAHHMSVVAVRSASAAVRLPAVSRAAAEEFDELSATAREALGEMRQLLGVLRGTDPAEQDPQPGLGDLRRIAERARSAGTPVELSVAERLSVPAATAVSAYRIVQEAVSNVTRHATGAPTRVRVDPGRDGTGLIVEIENGPPPGPPQPTAGTGYGLAGMRERARLLGGTLDARRTSSGGFLVRAELPTGGAR